MAPGKHQFSNKRYFYQRLLEIKNILYVILICAIGISCKNPPVTQAEKRIDPVRIQNAKYSFPTQIEGDIQAKYPGIVQVQKSDYARLFWDFYDAGTLPFKATTDINNDQKNDFAFIVKQHNLIKVALALSDGEKYRYQLLPFTLGPLEKQGIDFGMEIKPAGRTDLVKPVNRSLLLQKNGFLIKKLEQDYLILYEENNEIASFKMK